MTSETCANCGHTKWMHVNSNNGKYVYGCKSKTCDCKKFKPKEKKE